jgi:hypothetical protein
LRQEEKREAAKEEVMSRSKKIFVGVTVGWLLSTTMLGTLMLGHKPVYRALFGMLWGLILLWILGVGWLTLRYREAVRKRVQYLNISLWLLFTLFATVMALIEEAVTVSMTNLAPLFGVKVGEAYITASANYFDVVAMHSVIVIVPQFAAWGWLLTRYAFRPFQVFLLFGLTGICDEAMFGGPMAFVMFAQWIFVYGLMVYLPAYCLPPNPRTRPVPWWLYPVAVLLPIFAAVPFVLLMTRVIAPNHPSIHFPPLRG